MLLRPGVTLMRGLSFSRRFSLMGAVLLLPLAALMVHAIAGLHARWQVTHAERQGSAVLVASLDGVRHAQTHGGLVSRALAGDTSVQAALQRRRDALTTAVGALDAGIGSAPGLALAGTWAPLRSQLQALATGEHPAEAPRSVALHSEQVAALSALSELLAQRATSLERAWCLVPGAWWLVAGAKWLVCVAGALAFGGVLYLAVAFYLAPMADCRRHHHVVGGGDAQKSRRDRAA